MTQGQGSAIPAGFHNGPSYLALPREPQPWIIKPLIPVGGLVNLYGIPKTGKSYAALGMAQAIASGAERWLGFEVKKHGRVAYLQVDTPRSEWADRLERIETAGYNLTNIYFADKLLAPYPFNLLDPNHLEWLTKSLDAINPTVVFVDTLRESHGGDENDSTVMRNVITNLVKAIGDDRAAVLISHSRKLPTGAAGMFGGDDLMNDNRGSGYIAGRMDSVIKLAPKTMVYQGRSVEKKQLNVLQDPETGLLIRDTHKQEVEAAVLGALKNITPETTLTSLARTVAQQTGISENTARTKLQTAIEAQGIVVKKGTGGRKSVKD